MSTCLLFWLLHARLKYNLLRNYGPTIDMIHERQKEYKQSNTIAKVEQRTKEWHTDHRNRATEMEQHFESWSNCGNKSKGKSIK